MDDFEAREELRLRLITAEQELKAAEAEFDLFVKQLDKYKKAIDKHKVTISMIRSRMVTRHIH